MHVLRLDEVDRTQREVPGGVLALVPRVLRLDYTKYEDSGTVTVGQYQNSGAKTGIDIEKITVSHCHHIACKLKVRHAGRRCWASPCPERTKCGTADLS